MNPICTLPATRKTFAKKVLNTLTEETRNEVNAKLKAL